MLFYDFHNDIVPLFSVMISVILSVLLILIAGAAALCVIDMIRHSRGGRYAEPLGVMLVLDIGFAAVCYLFKDTEIETLVIFVSASAFSLLISFICCKIGKTAETDDSKNVVSDKD